MPRTPKEFAYRKAALQFQRALEEMEIWSANSNDYSFFSNVLLSPDFMEGQAMWRHGVRFTEAAARSRSSARHLSLSTRPKSPAMRC